ncbi:MAG TPA: hypothetical protein VGC39_03340 [Candidatus Methylacidiphilales bacterium]
MSFILKVLSLVASCLLVQQAEAQEQSYWVWQRTDPLIAQDVKDLRAAGVKELYWHVGTINRDRSSWHWRERLPVDWVAIRASCQGMQIIPVIRIEASSGLTFPEDSRAPLRKLLENLLSSAGSRALQIDYESPDRLIDEYADFLRGLKDQGRSWRLSISALVHWSKFGRQLTGCADEITPMFYDLDPRSERLVGDGMPPLVGTDISSQLESWRSFPIPWKAGLPNFSRVTIIAPEGKNRGNLRGWTWNDIIFASFLQMATPTAAGQTLLEVKRDSLLGYTPLYAQEHLDLRYPDRGQLRRAERESLAAGAHGVIYFRLADENDPSGFSVRDLNADQYHESALRLTRDDSGRFVLTNIGTTDLMPAVRGAGADERGYALEIEAQAPVWREAIAGDFAKATTAAVGASGSALGSARLEFWFAHLASGNSLATGYIDEAPSTKAVSIRWRIRNLKEELWHPLE